jgi:hypothetical protein
MPEKDVPIVGVEQAVLALIQYGRDRCGIGFGKFPLGIREALKQLLPVLNLQSDRVTERLADFDERMRR